MDDCEVLVVIIVLFKSKISKFFVHITLNYSYDYTACLIVPSDSLLYLSTTGMQSEREEAQDIKQIQTDVSHSKWVGKAILKKAEVWGLIPSISIICASV